MSGHSKWSTIKRQKGAKDAKRGQVFTKLARLISVAVREGGGGGDPESNFRLRMAIDKAKVDNMPNDNIKRAIERGVGKGDGGEIKTVIYEGYGPCKIAFIVECMTDNSNRTVAELKSLVERRGGTLAVPGAVDYMFKDSGLIVLTDKDLSDNKLLEIIDYGAEDVEEVGDGTEVYVKPEETALVRDKLSQAGFKVKSMEIIKIPLNKISLPSDELREKVTLFLENIDELDDVQQVFCNADL